MPIDQHGVLRENIFSFATSKEGKVFISWHGKPVTTLQGKEAKKFIARIGALDEMGAQLLMARLTGNFKRGNERKGDA